jgi:hypothetical protein
MRNGMKPRLVASAIDLLGNIHEFRWIADIDSFDTKKAEPFLTLPYSGSHV